MAGARQYILWQQDNGEIRFADYWGNWVDTDPIDLRGAFHHAVAIFRGVSGDAITLDNAEIWVDGENRATHASGSWSPTDLTAFAIGYDVAFGGSYFQGQMALVRIYNRALSETEVSEHYEAVRGLLGP